MGVSLLENLDAEGICSCQYDSQINSEQFHTMPTPEPFHPQTSNKVHTTESTMTFLLRRDFDRLINIGCGPCPGSAIPSKP